MEKSLKIYCWNTRKSTIYIYGYPPTTKYATALDNHLYGKSNCASYISWALQKAGVLPKGKMFSATQYTINGYVNTKKFYYYVPANLTDSGNKHYYHTKKKKMNLKKNLWHWNCPKQKWIYYKQKTGRDIHELIDMGVLKKGDIISQRDGSGNHLLVYMGGKENIVLYAVGAGYQTLYGRPCNKGNNPDYYCKSKNNYLVKQYILTSYQDCRNNHNHPQVAMIIRIKHMNYKQ